MDTRRSLEELDGQVWGEAPVGSTGLVVDVHRLRMVPIGNLADGELRMLLGQRIGVEWLIPLALERLDGEAMVGAWYPGDLLRAVLHAGVGFWDSHPEELMRLWAVRESLERMRSEASKLLGDPEWPRFG